MHLCGILLIGYHWNGSTTNLHCQIGSGWEEKTGNRAIRNWSGIYACEWDTASAFTSGARGSQTVYHSWPSNKTDSYVLVGGTPANVMIASDNQFGIFTDHRNADDPGTNGYPHHGSRTD